MDGHQFSHLSYLSAVLMVLLWTGISYAQKDCTGVECQPLENCIEEVLEPGECCATCLQHGCTCEGYQYYDCVNMGFVNGKVPEGQSYPVDFGSTECTCPKGGGKISCQFMLCPELPPHCIDSVLSDDGCPQCRRIGCLHEDQKYVAGHTFHVPHCKVCHCPNSGGKLMCYQIPDCDKFSLTTESPLDTEENEPERHYDDPYSYDQEAPEGAITQVESPKKHRSYAANEEPDSVIQEQSEDYDYPTVSATPPTLAQPVSHAEETATALHIHTPTPFLVINPTEKEEERKDISTPVSPTVQNTSKKAPATSSIPEEQTTAPAATPKHVVVEFERKSKGKQGDRQRNEQEGSARPKTKKHLRKDYKELGNSTYSRFKEANITESHGPKTFHETQEGSSFPKVKFSSTTSPPIVLKEDQKQPQTLYRYHPEEEEDPNSIHTASRLPEGSTKDLIETCCAAGQQWAIDNEECMEIPISGTDGDICRIAQKQCCVSYLKENSCVTGMIAAKEGVLCGPDESDTCGGSSYKQCCDCCSLGLRVKSEGKTCESNPNLGYPCNHVMLSCCEGEDHLISPEIKRHPEPLPTMSPEKISEIEDHNEALSISNEAELSNNLPGDDLDECILYPGDLCQHLCINTVGSYKCSCFPRYTLQDDGLSCLPDPDEGQTTGLAEETTVASEMSQAQPAIIDIVPEEPDKCKDNGPCKHICSVVEGNVVCSCLSGYAITADKVSCEDLDECLIGTHICSRRQLCVNTLGSFSCVSHRVFCAEGFILNRHRKCVDINECVTDAHNCSRREHCINTIGSFKCLQELSCQPGYELKEGQCVDIDECAKGTHSCKVNFVCQNTEGSFYCESKQRCMNGFLQDPEGNCVDINECTSLSEPCKPGFNCINTVGSYTCQRNMLMCSRGYHSSEDGSRCIDVDECQTGVHRCGEGQICHNLPGSYRCDCKMGYHYDAFSRTCIDINECWNYPGRLCQHTCENTPGSYHCSCSSGFRLAYDGKHCEDVNECDNKPCSQECANVYGSYQCYCRQGYQLAEDGHACKDIDECTQSAGILCTFRCVNVPGSYQCACPEQGYTMAANGRTCRDIDECALGTHNCSSTESCYNIQGSFRCLLFECPPNYRKVSDMRCERINCFNYLDCQNTPVRITYYQLNFQTNIVVPAHIFRIGPSPAYAGDNIILTINKGNEEGYFSTRKLNSYTGIVYLQRQVKEPKDFLLDVEMKLWRQGTYTTFLAKIYIFITGHAY
ncbi:PREDICTED: fibulin-2 isoform X1 [Crocodylus porosus]|uniref:Fibulin-2 n=1 Tax=Crocodylus porosus TaxID=8502 RepID=A0A7M4G3K2_CROPO|nr:PREDICTED: fibulin-2 isoform X1 [Crocodylus porosus]XP_019392502.1 PREDICTED: fibulin-2 isoform X1 [Crocodylus porosus]XP_019392503.1 PREDICTED: fibulin-2 isoform X1 [Crocodylus porosus]